MKQGDMVIYVCEFDADDSYSPNLAPGIVTKVNNDGTLDLMVFFMNGSFMKLNCKEGCPNERMTWFRR